jgi:hypothetical protein
MSDRRPDYGPSGYLPEKASRRARKIVLRAPLGLPWVLAAVAAGVVLLVVGVVFLARAGDPPGPPFVPVGPVDAVGAARFDPERGVLLVGATGRVRAFVAPPDSAPPRYCERSQRLESADGRVWSLTGRALDGGPSLDRHPAVVHDGTVYVDFSTITPGPPPEDAGAEPSCF